MCCLLSETYLKKKRAREPNRIKHRSGISVIFLNRDKYGASSSKNAETFDGTYIGDLLTIVYGTSVLLISSLTGTTKTLSQGPPAAKLDETKFTFIKAMFYKRLEDYQQQQQQTTEIYSTIKQRKTNFNIYVNRKIQNLKKRQKRLIGRDKPIHSIKKILISSIG
jgi:hypothetical protein